jgi:hypothetical protein
MTETNYVIRLYQVHSNEGWQHENTPVGGEKVIRMLIAFK